MHAPRITVALGALLVSGVAIAGGAAVTQRALAADARPSIPIAAVLTVKAAKNGPIICTYPVGAPKVTTWAYNAATLSQAENAVASYKDARVGTAAECAAFAPTP